MLPCSECGAMLRIIKNEKNEKTGIRRLVWACLNRRCSRYKRKVEPWK